MIQAFLVHLSMNMWEDYAAPDMVYPPLEAIQKNYPETWQRLPNYWRGRLFHDVLACDDEVWRNLVARLGRSGCNMLVIDIGDGVKYTSHPEIAVEGAWSCEKLRQRLDEARALGMEVIPKLNFSTSHDAWLQEYSRMVSTPVYYRVCADLIRECCELFDAPRFFHIGMDEESAKSQDTNGYLYRVVRHGKLWWHDLNFLVEEVKRCGARPMMWSDKIWDCPPGEYSANIPREVVQCNWYYYRLVNEDDRRVAAFRKLEELDYDQLPCASNWGWPGNLPELKAYCLKHIRPEHLLGFMMAPWVSTEKPSEEALWEACNIMAGKIDR